MTDTAIHRPPTDIQIVESVSFPIMHNLSCNRFNVCLLVRNVLHAAPITPSLQVENGCLA